MNMNNPNPAPYSDQKIRGCDEPPANHGGYATVDLLNRQVTGYFKYYGTAHAKAKGGIVVRANDVQRHGYV